VRQENGWSMIVGSFPAAKAIVDGYIAGMVELLPPLT
jgi:hypothetical protein